MKRLIGFFISIIAAVTGRFSWTAPPWITSINGFRKNKPGAFYSLMILFFLIVCGSVSGYIYWKKMPKPDLIVLKTRLAEIKPPSEEIIEPEPLYIDFSRESSKGGPALSAARLDLAGKPITSGIAIEPAFEGAWSWEASGRTIKFQPKNNWPAARKFTVSISPEILEKKAKLKENRIDFETSKFKATFEVAPKFYTDPRNRSVHQAIATAVFTHFVEEKSIREGLSLSFPDKSGKNVPVNYSLTIDKTGRRAHILSDPLKIGAEEQFMTVSLDKRLKTSQGGAGLSEDLSGKLKIPAVSTFFTINEMRATIIPDLKKEPEQTITLAFSDSIKRKTLDGKIKAWLLPLKNPENEEEHWTSQNEVTPALLEKSGDLPLKLAETLGESSDRFGLVFDAPEGRDIYVKIESGIKSDSGYELSKKYDAVMRAPSYPKEAKIVGQGGFMASSGSKTLSIQARGVEAVKVFVRRLLPQQLHHLVTQTYGDITNPSFHNWNFSEANISEGFEKVIPLSPKDSKTPVYTSLNLSEYIDPNGIKPGVFFIEIKGWDTENNAPVTQSYDDQSEYSSYSAAASGNANNAASEEASGDESSDGNGEGSEEGEYAEGEGYNSNNSYARSYQPSFVDKRTIIVTDLAILIKNGVDKGRDIFVESVSSGSPAKDVEISVVAKNGQALQSGRTGEDGHVVFPELGESSDPGREAAFCMVKKGSDISFLPFNRSQRQLDMSRFDIGGVNTGLLDKNQLNAFVFTDRGIYRPGETANIAFMVRSKGLAIPAGIPLQIHISGPQGTLLKKNIQVPETGFFDINFPSNPASATGAHQAELFILSEKGQTDRMIGSVSFKIEEFEPDRMKMASVLSDKNPGWALPENLSANVTLKNLFGSPAQNRKVKGKLILQPTGFSFDKYPGYVFTDPLTVKDKPLKAVIQEIEESVTDSNGQTEVKLDLGRFEKGTYRMTLSLEGFDEGGGRGVKAFNTSLVSPMKVIAGFKADGDLAFVRQGSERNISFVAVNRQLEGEALEKLTMKKIKIVSVSALVRQPNGTYAYQSAKKEDTVWEKPFAVPVSGQKIALETEEAGEYALEIKDETGTVICRASYTVAGQSNIKAEIEKTAELGIKLATQSVKAGEEIELQITTPYKGAGLITIETDKVYGFSWFKSETLTSVQKIKVPENLEGNAYVSVALVRSLDDPEIFTSPLSYATAPFSIDRTRRTLTPEIKVPEKVVPGTKMPITYKTDRPCKIVVFAVDEGILQFAGYKTPIPLDHFLKKVALEVTTQQTADLILPEYLLLLQRMGAGGDADAEALRAKHLNPFARKNNKPAVFWSGIIDSGPEEKTVEWETPDTFSGEVRVMAVAVDAEGMGSNQKSVIVRGPFVVSPVMPLAVTPGDIFTLTAGIANVSEGSGKAFPVNLKIEADKSLTIEGGTERKLSIDEGSEAVETFSVKTTGAPGNATIKFMATSGDLAASTSASLSVRPPVPAMTTLKSGVADSGKATLKLDRKIIPEFSSQKISVSASPLVLATGLESWLVGFPYGCTEQLLSKGLPALVYASYPGNKEIKENASEKVRAAISMLRERQNQDGGIAMWPGGTTDEFASLYASHFLIDASQAGFQIPKDLLDRATGYLTTKVGEWTGQDKPRLRAYAIYLLTRNGTVTSNYLIDLEKDLEKIQEQKKTQKDKPVWKEDITASFMASSYKLMKEDRLATGLQGKFKASDKTDFDDVFFGSRAADAIDVYLTAKHFPEKLGKVTETRLDRILDPVLSNSYHTFEAAWTVLALGAWTGSEPDDSFSVSAVNAAGEAKQLDTKPSPFPTASFGTEIATLDIKGSRKLFYAVSQDGFDSGIPKTDIKEGLEILREFKPVPEKLNQPVKPGDDITVVLKIRSLNGKFINNAAVTDMFAGCFSPDIKSVRANSGLSYIDVREDRAVFYGSFGPEIKEISYKLRVTAAGEFTVPPAFGESLYDSRVRARSLPGVMKVVGK
ncbi:alpha-2-macroglobulin family protein [Desulforegula conservatrix]|uniref:alpha-2-macroglobulin family protein n=1 Tax=Desulforegula conservatrix TaxID=153026 RepID=UPI00040F2841|nr:MG2 domain-containing protein [Desulforegula conservatrix]